MGDTLDAFKFLMKQKRRPARINVRVFYACKLPIAGGRLNWHVGTVKGNLCRLNVNSRFLRKTNLQLLTVCCILGKIRLDCCPSHCCKGCQYVAARVVVDFLCLCAHSSAGQSRLPYMLTRDRGRLLTVF